MKKQSLFIILAAGIIALIIVASCRKTYNTGSAAATPSLNQLFAALRPTPQSLSVTAGRDTIVYGADGTMLHFYTYSFKDANNNIITSGTIHLQLTEMYKAGDMIANRATTMANGQILQSAGQIYLTATLNGQQVYANKYGIGFKHNNASIAPMAYFYGNTANADSVATWTQSDTTQNGTKAQRTIWDSTGVHPPAYLFVFDSSNNFNWANCDWFSSSDSPKITVSIILPDTSFNPNNTQLYVILPNVVRQWTTDSVIAVLSNIVPYVGGDDYTAATNKLNLISEGQTAIVPAGLNYELVVITNKNGQYYYYEQSGTVPDAGILATAAMAPVSAATITAKLQAL